MIAAVPAFLLVADIVLAVHHLQILAFGNQLRQPFNILFELAHNADAGNILNTCFQLVHGYIQLLGLGQNAGNLLYPPRHELNRRIFLPGLEFRPQELELDLQLLHRLLVREQKLAPISSVHPASSQELCW
ncbi:hypothetical protein D3C76_1476370 [compost metagenome]